MNEKLRALAEEWEQDELREIIPRRNHAAEIRGLLAAASASPEAPAPDLVALVDAYGEAVGALHSWGGAPREARASAAKAALLAAISRALSEARAAAELRAEEAERESSDRYMMLQAAIGAADTAKRERDDHRQAEASAWQQREEIAAERDAAESRATALASRVSALEGALQECIEREYYDGQMDPARAALSAPAPDAPATATPDGHVHYFFSPGPGRPFACSCGRLSSDPAPAPGDATARCACGLHALSGPDECVDDQNRKVHTVARCGFGLPYPVASSTSAACPCDVCIDASRSTPAPAAGSPDTRTCDDHRADGPDPIPNCGCAAIDRLCARRAPPTPTDPETAT